MAKIAEILDRMDYGPAPESPAQADAWLDAHQRRFGLFVDGVWRDAADGAVFETRNPATGAVLATIAQAGAADVDAAVAAARRAQPGWQKLGGHGRARYLYALARHLQRNARLFAVLETMDNGKPIRESRDIDVPLAIRHFYHHAGWAQLIGQEFPGQRAAGVAGQIIPWNFPLLMLAWKVAPALAAGCTAVLKPAEYTPLTALLFAEACRAVGLPAGVVNIVTGDGGTGAAIVAHPGIDKIAFTGSTEVGRLIREQTAGSGKGLSLELGGKSPFIVFDDADLDAAVEGVVDAIWFNQGQVCCAGSRLLVQEGVADRMVARLKARMAKLRVGDPLDKSTDIGPIVDAVQLDRIRSLVRTGVEEGAACWGQDLAVPAGGLYHPPLLLTGVEPASTVAQVEIFGPVLAAMTFRTPGEAVELANNSRYGLAASLWSETIGQALEVAAKLRAGVVWVNCTNQFDAAVGFGGVRESGFGREGGADGMRAYLVPDRPEPGPYRAIAVPEPVEDAAEAAAGLPALDRTPKLYIGGRQVRPDSGYSRDVIGASGRVLGQVGEGNRKDIRNAVEAASKAGAWASMSGHGRAQVLYYLAENLEARGDEFARRLAAMTGASAKAADAEVAASVQRLFFHAAWADKFDGTVRNPPLRGVALAMNEPVGVVGVACPDETPLLGFVSLVAPLVAMGNRVVAVPSPTAPLAATDLYQVLDTSDVPAGVVNIVTGARDALARVLAEHEEVDGLWYVGPAEGGAAVERASAGNLKRTWTNRGRAVDWSEAEGPDWLRRAVEVKSVWVPYGA